MNSSDLDRRFDDGESFIEVLDVSAARRQWHAQKRVNVDFSIWMVEQLDQEANRLGVTRQSIIKVWLAERLEQSKGPREKRSLMGCAWRPSSEWLCDDQALGQIWGLRLQFKHETATGQDKAEMAGGSRSGHCGGGICRHDGKHPPHAADHESCGRLAADTCVAPAP